MSIPSPVSAPLATLLDEPEGFQVVAPATRSVPVVVFLGLWLWGWAAGEVFAIAAIFAERTPLPGQLFLATWLAFWTIGGVAAIYAVLFQLVGRERLVLAADELRVRREVFGIGGWKHLPFDQVRGIRALGASLPEAARPALAIAGVGGGGILIHTSGRPLRFGFALGPEESAAIVSTLRQRHAFPDGPPEPTLTHRASAA